MRRLPIIYSILAALLLLTGCIKEEALNREADIESVTPSSNEGVLNVTYQNSSIIIYVDGTRIDVSNFSLNYTLAEGATITPNPASVTDYSRPQQFVVTSEDGLTHKTYQIEVQANDMPTYYSFDEWYSPDEARYMLPYTITKVDTTTECFYLWACGNEAFVFAAGRAADYTKYPTQPTTDVCTNDGGKAVKLITMSTPEPSKPIASGSLFIGDFDASDYEPLNGTHFGLPLHKKPLAVTGWYKYKPEKLDDGTKDACKMIVTFFRTDDKVSYLNGFTIKNSPYIVARAEIADGGETEGDGYHPFRLTLDYTADVDPVALQQGKYRLSINFASSCNGDIYEGAIGSTMWIDNVNVECEN